MDRKPDAGIKIKDGSCGMRTVTVNLKLVKGKTEGEAYFSEKGLYLLGFLTMELGYSNR